MKLVFIYSKESEIARVKYTVSNKDFYQKNYGKKSFGLPLPKGCSLNNLSKNFEEIVERELDQNGAEKVKRQIRKGLKKNYSVIEKFFLKNFNRMPETITIKLTKYGTGGSYMLPDGLTINFRSFKNYIGNIIHELVHCQIEENIVRKHNLTQQEKESIVEWLTFSDPKIKALDPHRDYYFGKPSNKLLRKVGLE